MLKEIKPYFLLCASRLSLDWYTKCLESIKLCKRNKHQKHTQVLERVEWFQKEVLVIALT